MSTYFGFLPSEELNKKINSTLDIIKNQPHVPLYPLQLEITNAYAQDILNHLVINLVEVIEDEDRQKKMQKVTNTVRSTIDLMNKQIIFEHPNDKAVDGLNYLLKKSIFLDNDGHKRIGFTLTDDDAQKILENFALAKRSKVPNLPIQIALSIIIKANLKHFVSDFTKHLHLSPIRSQTVPIAESAINKASKIIVNKLLPETPYDACMNIVNHFESSLVTRSAIDSLFIT